MEIDEIFYRNIGDLITANFLRKFAGKECFDAVFIYGLWLIALLQLDYSPGPIRLHCCLLCVLLARSSARTSHQSGWVAREKLLRRA